MLGGQWLAYSGGVMELPWRHGASVPFIYTVTVGGGTLRLPPYDFGEDRNG